MAVEEQVSVASLEGHAPKVNIGPVDKMGPEPSGAAYPPSVNTTPYCCLHACGWPGAMTRGGDAVPSKFFTCCFCGEHVLVYGTVEVELGHGAHHPDLRYEYYAPKDLSCRAMQGMTGPMTFRQGTVGPPP